MSATKSLSGWGRYPVLDCRTAEPPSTAEAARPHPERLGVARGNGRSYGDSSLAAAGTVLTKHLDRLLAFDPATGQLTCEAGTLLADVVATFVPRGWFPPVTPGTKWVSVGGMIAADVHGKNHHGTGSFCEHVVWLDLALGDGNVLRCSRTEHAELFAATCGGMGLTGIILAAAFTMIPVATARIAQTIERAANLDAALALFEAGRHWTYSVAWVDCLANGADLGRSVVFFGEHATQEQLPAAERATPLRQPVRGARRVPFDFPAMALNRFSVRAFNTLYYQRQRPGSALVDIDPYFYPLDALLDWNRIYGKPGFVQYQCVLPFATSREGLRALLAAAAADGSASFLAVLKLMGRPSFGLMSFPMEGYTLTLDFPVTPPTMRLLERFDAIVREGGGRIYLAKDARMGAEMLAGYPGLAEFRAVRQRYGLDQRFRSAQSDRLGL
ncbi:MAG: FAD-binding oxidoreductase [Acetobacteraceae bacterium]